MTGETPAHGVPLANTRTTFQRVRDARFFTGRIRRFSQKTVSVLCSQDTQLDIGDTFSFHVFGSGHEAMFFAVLRGEVASKDPGFREYVFLLENDIQLRTSTQDARFITSALFADLVIVDCVESLGVRVLDISANGLCLTSTAHLRKGDVAKLTIHIPEGLIHAEAEVRYCLRDRVLADHHRIGFRLKSLDRVSMIRWRNLYCQVVHSSRYDAFVTEQKAS